jgi:putative iron-regulated protein
MKLKVMFKNARASLFVSSLASLVAACSGDPGGAAPLKTDWKEVAKDARVTYADIVLASYEDSVEGATTLDGELAAFVADPSEDGLVAARQAWLAAREPYLQTEVYRFYDGPIDNPDDGPEGLLNAWPLDENYIDYTADDAAAGIINDPAQDISAEALAGLNEGGGEKNISTGYHAIEFLLWGQDLSETGPGDRQFTDYVTDGNGTAENQDRRGEYLGTVSSLMLENLQGLVDAWSKTSATANYRDEFLSVEPEESLTRILTGMILLAGNETGGERLQTAFETGEQEDEHSCFSDNTHRDMIQDVQGIVNVWDGLYERTDGTRVQGVGVYNVLLAENAELAGSIDEKIAECLELANALEPPFDREIAVDNPDGNARVEALIVALFELDDLLRDAFATFNLDVPTPPQ